MYVRPTFLQLQQRRWPQFHNAYVAKMTTIEGKKFPVFYTLWVHHPGTHSTLQFTIISVNVTELFLSSIQTSHSVFSFLCLALKTSHILSPWFSLIFFLKQNFTSTILKLSHCSHNDLLYVISKNRQEAWCGSLGVRGTERRARPQC